LACLLIGGCSSSGGDEESDADSEAQSKLVGKWILRGDVCDVGVVFWGEGKYEVDTVCPLTDGSYGIEAEGGSFGSGDGIVDFVPEFASCFSAGRDYSPYSMSFTV